MQPLDESTKVSIALVKHVYNQAYIGIAASFFCACVVFIGLYSSNNINLYIWGASMLAISIARFILVWVYNLYPVTEKKVKLWQRLYTIGATLGGIGWGLGSILLFPDATPIQKTLLVLMLAGVTGGSLPLNSAIPEAVISFLIFSITPYIVSFMVLKDTTYLLFDASLIIYLIFSITLVIKGYEIIKNSIVLQFENDALLSNLSDAKRQLEIINRKLEEAATHDSLTKVANRRLFEENFKKALKTAEREQKWLALLFIDLDHFKEANDLHGHHIGDFILIESIRRIKKCFIHNEEMIFRLGGDEFAIVLEVTDLNKVKQIAQEICNQLAEPMKTEGLTFKISASIGISLYPLDGKDIKTLLQCADRCMYVVKKQGGDNFHFSSAFESQLITG